VFCRTRRSLLRGFRRGGLLLPLLSRLASLFFEEFAGFLLRIDQSHPDHLVPVWKSGEDCYGPIDRSLRPIDTFQVRSPTAMPKGLFVWVGVTTEIMVRRCAGGIDLG